MVIFIFVLSLGNYQGYWMAPRFWGEKVIVTGPKFQGIYTFNPVTNKTEKLLDANGFYVSFSADGTKLAVRAQDGVLVYDVTRKRPVKEIKGELEGYPIFQGNRLLVPVKEKTLVFNENLKKSGALPFSFTFGTTGGDRLAFSRNDSIFLFDFKKFDLIFVKGGDGTYFMPVISPDGNYIVYSKLGYGLYLYSVEKGEEIFVSKGGNPSWRGDSKMFVFSLVEDNGDDITGADLFLFRVPDGKLEQLTQTPHVFELLPSFSPDGKEVVYNTYDGKIGFIHVKE